MRDGRHASHGLRPASGILKGREALAAYSALSETIGSTLAARRAGM